MLTEKQREQMAEKNKTRKLVHGGVPKIITFKEKHGDLVFIVNSELELHKVCKSIIKERKEDGWMYGYVCPKKPKNKTGFESEDQIEKLPEGDIKEKAIELWGYFNREMKSHKEALNFYNCVKTCLKYKFNPDDKFYTRNMAYSALCMRSNYEYEYVELESPCKMPEEV